MNEPSPTRTPWWVTVLIPSAYPLALVVFWFAPMQFGFGFTPLVYVGFGFGFVGLMLWILGMLHLGRSFAVLPGSDHLVTTGIYRYLRHPVYLGISLTLMGLALCLGSVWGLVYLAGVVVPLNIVRATLENKQLKETFGNDYERWRAGTWI